jgi:accessory gene regulator protein AgrB
LGLYNWSPVEKQNKALSESKKSKNRKKSLIYSAFLILASYALYCLKSREGFIISLTMFIVALLLPIGIAVNKAVVIKNGKEEPQCLLSYKEQSFH